MDLNRFTFESNCAIWEIKLPHLNRWCRSPDFSLDGSEWYLQASCSGKENVKCRGQKTYTETWTIRLISCSGEKLGKYVIVPYVEKENSVYKTVKRTLYGYIELWRDHEVHDDTIKMFFLFTPVVLTIPKVISDQKKRENWKPLDSEDVLTHSPSFESLSEDMTQLLNSKENSDVVLKCGTRTFSVHKSILATRSAVFAAMFKHDMKESNTGVVDIADIDSSVLEQFVQYLYSGRVKEMTMVRAMELHQVAQKYAVHSLKLFCASFMHENLSKEVVCNILSFAHQIRDSNLLEAAVCFAAETEGFVKTEEWKDFATKHPKIGTSVFLKYINNS